MKLFIHNSFHNGDVLLTRVIIESIIHQWPTTDVILECREKQQYLWHSFEREIKTYGGSDHLVCTPTKNCPNEFIFINMWFGTFNDILNEYGLTHVNQIQTFNRQMHLYHTNTFLSIPITYTGLNISNYKIDVPPNSILIENGPCSSSQCSDSIHNYIPYLSNDFPELNFICSNPPGFLASNVFDFSRFNLLQFSSISKMCKFFITSASGVNASTYSDENKFKSRFFFGWNYQHRLWDGNEIPITAYDDLKTKIRRITSTAAGESIRLAQPM